MKHKHHIIPRHMGGSDDPSNLIELTPEEHAEAHRILYEEHGRWQDYVAWQGLAKLASKEDHVHMLLSAAGKKGAAISNGKGRRKGMKYNTERIKATGVRKGANNPCAKEYSITHPHGLTEQTKSLKTWCESKGMNYNSFWNATIAHNRTFKGYKARLL